LRQAVYRKSKDLDISLGGDQKDGFGAGLSTSGQEGLVLGPVVGASGEMLAHVDFLADAIADALTAENLPYYSESGSKIAKAYNRRVLCRAWGGALLMGGHASVARPPRPRASPERPKGPKQTPPSSQPLRRSERS
jgi:hypothetical protein